ncbi:topoisomerase DNA-binding C4 zinc finger domain-containing protein [Paenibacillus validus]|uniref:topoisomerase DNA-binding C4 zinc finger domain-containing protein n=1 Tax=Paenibacillus validus TaxID=44253 RepID=UPI003D2CB85F
MINHSIHWLSSGPIQFPKLPFGPIGWMLTGLLVLSIIVAILEQATKGKRKRRKRGTTTNKRSGQKQASKAWGKWQPGKKPRPVEKRVETAVKSEIVKARKEAAATSTICKCGSHMVRRKSKNGEEFLGCSKFPSCRHTRAI